MEYTNEQLGKMILEKLGIAEFPEEIQAEFVERLGGLVLNAVVARSLPLLPDEGRAQIEIISEDPKKDSYDILHYLSKQIDDFEIVLQEETSRIIGAWEQEMAAVEV